MILCIPLQIMSISNGTMNKVDNSIPMYEFMGKIPDELVCKLCNRVLAEPRQVVCCGGHYCKSCIEKRITVNYTCPQCKATNFNHFRDVHFEQRVMGLKVHCPHHKRGCKWSGELGMLRQHLNAKSGGCLYETDPCPNKCGERIPRKDIKEHLMKQCILRRVKCQFCGAENTYKVITTDHYSVCPNYPVKCAYNCNQKNIKRCELQKHEQACPMRPVVCPFQKSGCKVKLYQKDIQDHMATYTGHHLELVTKAFESFQTRAEVAEKELKAARAEIEDLRRREDVGKKFSDKKLRAIAVTAEELVKTCTDHQRLSAQTIRSLTDESFHLKQMGQPVIFQMVNYSEYKRSGKTWYSPPFYVAGGYKMCLAIQASGIGSGHGLFMSVSLCLMRGEFDDELPWPVELPFHLIVEMLRSEGFDNTGNASAPPNPKTYMYFHADTPTGRVTEGVLIEARKCEMYARHDLVEEWMLFYDAITFQVTAESEFL